MPHLGGLPLCKDCGVAHRPNVSCPAKGQSVDDFNKAYGIGLVKPTPDPGESQNKKVELGPNTMWFCMTHLCWHQAGQSCIK
jgi:hypothetical protein